MSSDHSRFYERDRRRGRAHVYARRVAMGLAGIVVVPCGVIASFSLIGFVHDGHGMIFVSAIVTVAWLGPVAAAIGWGFGYVLGMARDFIKCGEPSVELEIAATDLEVGRQTRDPS